MPGLPGSPGRQGDQVLPPPSHPEPGCFKTGISPNSDLGFQGKVLEMFKPVTRSSSPFVRFKESVSRKVSRRDVATRMGRSLVCQGPSPLSDASRTPLSDATRTYPDRVDVQVAMSYANTYTF